MELFEKPQLPTMLNGNVMCIDAKAWNQLITYINFQTLTIESLTTRLKTLESNDSRQDHDIKELANDLKEFLE